MKAEISLAKKKYTFFFFFFFPAALEPWKQRKKKHQLPQLSNIAKVKSSIKARISLEYISGWSLARVHMHHSCTVSGKKTKVKIVRYACRKKKVFGVKKMVNKG